MADEPLILPEPDVTDDQTLLTWLRACQATGARTAEHLTGSIRQIHDTLYGYARAKGMDHDEATKAAALVTDPLTRAAGEMVTFADELQLAAIALKTQTDLPDGETPPALPAGGTAAADTAETPAAAAAPADEDAPLTPQQWQAIAEQVEADTAQPEPVGDVGPGGWYTSADGEGPYLDWSGKAKDEGRIVELGDGTDAVAVELDRGQLEQLRDELGRTAAGDPQAYGAVDLDNGEYIDWSSRTDDGSRVRPEVGDTTTAVQIEVTDEQLRAVHAQLDQDLADDHAARQPAPGAAEAAPPAGTLIQDDPHWWYQGNGVTTATRRIRVYEMPDGRLTAVVTESGEGTSITNAAETVVAQIHAEHPGRQIDVIEHYPASTFSGEYFDMVQLNERGRPEWTSVPAEQVRARLGADAFLDGTGPAPRDTSNDGDQQWYVEAQGGAMDGRRVYLDGGGQDS